MEKGLAERLAFWSTLVTTIILFIGGFLCPPMGIIDDSMLQAGAILALFAVIGQLPSFLQFAHSGKPVRWKKGDMSFEANMPFNHDEDAD